MDHIDLHVHLLPGVDDGPPTLDAAIAHARRLVRDGVQEVLVTPHVGHPHFDVDPHEVAVRCGALQDVLDREGIWLLLHPGGEVHADGAAVLDAAALGAVAAGPPGGRWVLLEAPFAGLDAAFLAAVRRLGMLGYGTVIAHPERAAGVLDGADRGARLRTLRAGGAVLQVSVDSLLGAHGPEVQDVAERLVRSGAAYVLGSDGHGGPRRSQTLDAAPALLAGLGLTAGQAHRLTSSNPLFLLRHGIPRDPWSREARRARERQVAAAREATRRVSGSG